MSCSRKNLRNLFILLTVFSSIKNNAQDSSSVIHHRPPQSVRDIPHHTVAQKWMWIHRAAVFEITKTHPVHYDTAYISSYYKRLVVTIPISTRFLQFSLKDEKTGNKLTFAPNLEYDVGISISSQWASFILNTGVKVYSGNEGTKGKTKYQDYQLNLYGRNSTTDITVQYYNGFYIKNSSSFSDYKSVQPYSIRPDINAIQIGVSSYYIFNNKKFSYGNSFSFIEQQKKSSGSFLLGIYYSYFNTSGNSSLVNAPFRSSFDTLSYIRNGTTNNAGINIGYIHTFVFFKKCYATASLAQGVGAEQVAYIREDNSVNHQLIGGIGKLDVRLALGYDKGRYFVGAMAMFDYYLFNTPTNSTFNYTFGKAMIYTGYRFSYKKSERKLLRRLKLIDY